MAQVVQTLKSLSSVALLACPSSANSIMVASEASSWQSATALRTACPGIDRRRSNLMVSAFVSTTTRALAFVDKDCGQLFLSHPSCRHPLADPVTEALKLVWVDRT